jgi:catechol 1,2-dioxygenase
MNVKVFDTKEVQDLLKAATNAEGAGGNARFKQVLGRLLGDLFKAIDDLDITPDEVWAGMNYLNKLGQDGEARCWRPASVSKSISTSAWTPPTPRRPRRRHAAHDRRPAVRRGRTGARGRSKIDLDADAGRRPARHPRHGEGPRRQAGGRRVVECWHANSNGFYSHFDPTGAQDDFNLRGAVGPAPTAPTNSAR